MKSIEQPLHSQMVERVEIEFRGVVNARANARGDMHGARKMVRSATVIKEKRPSQARTLNVSEPRPCISRISPCEQSSFKLASSSQSEGFPFLAYRFCSSI